MIAEKFPSAKKKTFSSRDFAAKRHQASVSKARAVVRGQARGYVRDAGYYGRFARSGASVGELKFHDLDIDDAVVSATGSITALSCNLIAQGTSEIQRIGRKCTIKSINWRMTFALPTTATAASTSDVTRVILYHDKQCNGATATVTGILESTDYQSFNNLANKNRFTTLMDKTVTNVCKAGSGRGTTDTLSYADDIKEMTFFKKCDIPIEFDSVAGAITEIRSNNLGVLTISRSGLTTFASKMRLRFQG